MGPRERGGEGSEREPGQGRVRPKGPEVGAYPGAARERPKKKKKLGAAAVSLQGRYRVGIG